MTNVDRKRIELMRQALGKLSPRDREILTRFYLHEHSPARICSQMAIPESHFGSIKARTKARFEELSKTQIAVKSAESPEHSPAPLLPAE